MRTSCLAALAASALLSAVAAAPSPLHLDTRAVTQNLSNLTVAVVRAPPSGWPSPILNKDWDQSDVGFNLNATVELGVKYIEEAAAAGATVIAFPECWFPGYPKGYDQHDWMLKHVDEYIENSLVVNSKQWNTIVAAAKANAVYVGLGFSERAGEYIYMGQALLSPEGETLIHRHKLRPSGSERALWSDGTIEELEVVSTPIGRISMLECWEHFHPAMTFPIQAQAPDLHIGPFPYNPQTGDVNATWWEDVETNLAAARVFAINAGTVTLTPGIGGAAIFSSTGVKIAVAEANESYVDRPIVYATGINATAFANVSYNANGEQSYGTLLQIEAAFPDSAKVNGTFTHRVNTTVDSLEAAAANYSSAALPSSSASGSSTVAVAAATGSALSSAVKTSSGSADAIVGLLRVAMVSVLGGALLV